MHVLKPDPVKELKAAGWECAEPFRNSLTVENLTLHQEGLCAMHPTLGQMVGASTTTKPDGDSKAWYELIERISTLQAAVEESPTLELLNFQGERLKDIPRSTVFPDISGPGFRAAKSNGVALWSDFAGAARGAVRELAERQLVLENWIGRRQPKILAAPQADRPVSALQNIYEIVVVSWGSIRTTVSDPLHGRSVFLFPKRPELPYAVGFGCHQDADRARHQAEEECLQVMSFYYGEELPDESPEPQPSPGFHQEFYQYAPNRRVLQQWLHGRIRACRNPGAALECIDPGFVILPVVIPSSGFTVVKALCPDTLPLVFGDWLYGHAGLDEEAFRFHPI